MRFSFLCEGWWLVGWEEASGYIKLGAEHAEMGLHYKISCFVVKELNACGY